MRDKATVKTLRGAAWLLPLAMLAGSCGDHNNTDVLHGIDAIVFLQRTPRGDQGNVFDYTSYAGGGKLVVLRPPSADGKPTTLFPTADSCVALGYAASCVDHSDIMSYDINFNADTI